MSNDKTTLADAQPGGRVRLGDQPWPEIDAILADAYSAGATGLPFEGIARRHAVRAAVAALSAQPSPVAYHGDVDLKWLSGSIGEVAHRLSTYMPTGLAEWADRARDCRIAAQVLSELSAQPSPIGQGVELDLDRVLSLADVHAEESREDGVRLLDRGGLLAFAQDVVLALAARQPVGVAFTWENFPAYLIDKCEGDTISEEGLQQALAAMAKDERYCLSAQPSPGGQDALAALQQDYDKLLDSFNRQVEVAEKIAGRALQQDDRIEELEEALAARQPVGEPVAYTDGNEFVCAAEYATMRGLGHDGNGWRPLYDGPPAKAVDLGQFIALAEFGEEFAFSAEKQPHSRVIYSQASRLLALIDGKAVGK
ncbi:TPA: hypothetical protein ACOFEQ_004053 [Stenotrophomonas maltophilia]